MAQDAVVMFEGTIYEEGYGWVAQKVMRDKEISTHAKAIYSYICSLAGNPTDVDNRKAFPSVSLMKAELGIKSQDTFYKHMNQLKEKGYLKVEQEKTEQGKFKRNIYKVVAVPKPDPLDQKNVPCSKKSTTVKPQSNFSTTEKPTTDNWNTNRNSFTRNSFNNKTDTIDTIDTNSPYIHKTYSKNEKQKQKEDYMEKAFYENNQHVPERLANMLKVFSDSTEMAKEYYNVILLAKKNAEKDRNEIIWLEHEPELEHEIINTFSRAIRKIEKERNIPNGNGYIYKAVLNLITSRIGERQRQGAMEEKQGTFYNWLEQSE